MSDGSHWTPWTEIAAENDPYVDWWRAADGRTAFARRYFPEAAPTAPPASPPQAPTAGATEQPANGGRGRDSLENHHVASFAAPNERKKERQLMRQERRPGAIGQPNLDDDDRVPIPGHCRNWHWDDNTSWIPKTLSNRLKSEGKMLGEDTVIVGVVDGTLPLGHRRYRLASGDTRFLAAWQQSARWSSSQEYLPFGRELYRSQINDLLRATSVDGDLMRSYDETEFNRRAGLVEPEMGPHRSPRDLDLQAAHGAHILDLVSGYDPRQTDPALLERCRLIGVGLPSRYVHGPGGNFLQFFAYRAVMRIVALANALWVKQFGHKQKRRFPVVVNLSYGFQAGPQDGSLPFEREIERLVEQYASLGGTLRICMPAGNTNLARSSARLTIKGKKNPKDKPLTDPDRTLIWRIMPEDPTSNSLEIWTPPVEARANPPKPGDFALWVTPPGHAADLPLPIFDKDFAAACSDLVDVEGRILGRVYCRVHLTGTGGAGAARRLQTVICLPPTVDRDTMVRGAPDAPPRVAPAGGWRIGFGHRLPKAQRIDVKVQVDQSGLAHNVSGRQSYLDHPKYQRNDDWGKAKDSYAYPYTDETSSNLERGEGPVQRAGTFNPLASSASVVMIGGYSIASGAPALYSATGRLPEPSHARELPHGRAQRDVVDIEALLPSEESVGHFGLLAGGSADGSVAAYRGTSMATALATRYFAEALLDEPAPTQPGAEWLREAAAKWEASKARPTTYQNTAPRKGGAGRLPMPESFGKGRIPRLG